jgi:hypothetical protein
MVDAPFLLTFGWEVATVVPLSTCGFSPSYLYVG